MPKKKAERRKPEEPEKHDPKRWRARMASKLDGLFIPSASDPEIKLPGVISTRCPPLDVAIGRGGVPMGRLTIATGSPGIGKTTLAIHLCAEAQSLGGIAIYVDKEQKLPLDYAERLGVNLDELFLKRAGSLEECMKAMDVAIGAALEERPNGPIVCVLDSIHTARTAREYDGEYDDQHVASQARVYSYAIPKLIESVGNKPVALFWISQVRESIGAYSARNTIGGGNAPKYDSSVVIDLTRGGFYKVSEKALGSTVKAKIIKNSIAVPFKECTFNIVWGQGIDRVQGIIDLGVQIAAVTRSGAWYTLNLEDEADRPKFQGRQGFDKLLETRPELLSWLEGRVKGADW